MFTWYVNYQWRARHETSLNVFSLIPTSKHLRKPLSDITLLIQSPRLAAGIMHRCPSHVPLELPHESPSHRSMHHTCIVPNHQIPWLFPLNLGHIFLLRGVFKQSINYFTGLSIRQAFDVVHMRRDIQIHSTGCLVSCGGPCRSQVDSDQQSTRATRVCGNDALNAPQCSSWTRARLSIQRAAL